MMTIHLFLTKAPHRGLSALSLANWRTQHHFFDSAGSHEVHHSCVTSSFGYLREWEQCTLYHRNTSDHRICVMRTAHSGRNVALLRVEDMRSMPRPGLQASINIARSLLPPSPSLLQALQQLHREIRSSQVIRCSVSAHCAFFDSVVKGGTQSHSSPVLLPPSKWALSLAHTIERISAVAVASLRNLMKHDGSLDNG